MSETKTKKLVMIALFVALNVVIVRFLSYQTATLRIGFGFITDALCAMMYGPLIGGVASAIADVVGMLVNSYGMPYFPGFTLNAALFGVSYGLLLHNRKKSWGNITVCVVVQLVLLDASLGSLWAWMFARFMLHKSSAFLAVMIPRLINALVMAPIKIVVIKALARALEHTPYRDRLS